MKLIRLNEDLRIGPPFIGDGSGDATGCGIVSGPAGSLSWGGSRNKGPTIKDLEITTFKPSERGSNDQTINNEKTNGT